MSKLLAGRYELIEKIGEGGMAVVYKARCRLLNRYVAIKILRPEYTKDKQFVESFKRESQAAAGLQHPNIVSVYDVGREGDINYIVMELVEGRPLSEIIEQRGPLDYKLSIDITKQVASALSLAHKNNIIHRDIKPHNIMITKNGVAKLADFGIAKAVSNATMVAETKKVIGSVHYFSPEQAKGAHVDERSDIYSLGVVLYEMLTGQVPFDGENPVQVAIMHINESVPSPSRIVGGIPPALENIVMRATSRYPSDRYANADDLIEDLDNIEFITKVVGSGAYSGGSSGGSVSVDREEQFPKIMPKKKKNKKGNKKLIFALLGVTLVACIGIAVFALFGRGEKADIQVPDLTGMSYEEAKAELKTLGLDIKKGDSVPSNDIKKGLIVSQLPLKGTKVSKGKTIIVNISAGKKMGVVPSLINKKYTSREDIDDMLSEFGYKLGNVMEEESDAEPGIIIEQTPSAGKSAKEGVAIDIVVSKEKSKPKVPSLTGLTVDAAKEAIINAGFTVGNISYGESNVYKGGYVMQQMPSAGSKLDKGNPVDIVVAKEQKPANNNGGNNNVDNHGGVNPGSGTEPKNP